MNRDHTYHTLVQRQKALISHGNLEDVPGVLELPFRCGLCSLGGLLGLPCHLSTVILTVFRVSRGYEASTQRSRPSTQTYLTGQDLRSTSETAREKFNSNIIPLLGWLRILRYGSNFRHGCGIRIIRMQIKERSEVYILSISADSKIGELV